MDENLIHMLANPYHIKKEDKYIKECLQDEFFRVLLRIFPEFDISKEDLLLYEDLQEVGYKYSNELDKLIISEQAVDYIYIGDKKLDLN